MIISHFVNISIFNILEKEHKIDAVFVAKIILYKNMYS